MAPTTTRWLVASVVAVVVAVGCGQVDEPTQPPATSASPAPAIAPPAEPIDDDGAPLFAGTDRRIYVFERDRTLPGWVGTVHRYDIPSEQWDRLAPPPLMGPVAAASGSRLDVLGVECVGESCEEGRWAVAAYDEARDAWSTIWRDDEVLLTEYMGGAVLAGGAFTIGGTALTVTADGDVLERRSPLPGGVRWCVTDEGHVVVGYPTASGPPVTTIEGHPTLAAMAVSTLPLDQFTDGSWSPPEAVPVLPGIDHAASVAVICLGDGVALLQSDVTATWRAGRWQTVPAGPGIGGGPEVVLDDGTVAIVDTFGTLFALRGGRWEEVVDLTGGEPPVRFEIFGAGPNLVLYEAGYDPGQPFAPGSLRTVDL